MSDPYIEILIEKALTAQKDLEEIKELIRSLPKNHEALTDINERLDVAAISLQQVETAIRTADQRVADFGEKIQQLEAAIDQLPNRVSIPRGSIDGLRQDIQDHSRQLSVPLEQETKHHHYLTQPMMVCIGLIILVLVLIGVLTDVLVKHWV